jgi:hypothetical protein
MSRPLRIEIEGALHHVTTRTTRGARCGAIFVDYDDRDIMRGTSATAET